MNSAKPVKGFIPLMPGIPSNWFNIPINHLGDLIERAIRTRPEHHEKPIDFKALDPKIYTGIEIEHRHAKKIAVHGDNVAVKTITRGTAQHHAYGRVRVIVVSYEILKPLKGEAVCDLIKRLRETGGPVWGDGFELEDGDEPPIQISAKSNHVRGPPRSPSQKIELIDLLIGMAQLQRQEFAREFKVIASKSSLRIDHARDHKSKIASIDQAIEKLSTYRETILGDGL